MRIAGENDSQAREIRGLDANAIVTARDSPIGWRRPRAYFIPSLTIQIFVENANWHGLFEKEGGGTISLTIADGDSSKAASRK
ncbi:hypothetical protein ACF3MZ_30625 [Paenibacillaceae bacterium WGS1546]|uniref:hypothetical protein n=1 Tax=Cohnella sp. WGS1546 TaxID=3366810 RepID=UPI00372D1258